MSIKKKMTNKAQLPKKIEKTPNWDIFDSIWCISFTGYKERKDAVESELKRIGIYGRSNFNWRFTFPTIFDNILFDVSKKINHNQCVNVPSMSCSLGHYGCIKAAYELGHEFTLIMEDDIRFLKDIGRIEKIMSRIPPCADVVNFDGLPSDTTKEEYEKAFEAGSYNDEFFEYKGMWGGSCYALSREAMKAVCIRYEQEFHVADSYISGRLFLGDDITYFSSKENVCCQVCYSNSNNVKIFGDDALHLQYQKRSLDYSKYNIFDKPDYDYGSFIERK